MKTFNFSLAPFHRYNIELIFKLKTFNFSLAPFRRYNIELIFKSEKETFVHMIVPKTKNTSILFATR